MKLSDIKGISIHSPLRGETYIGINSGYQNNISIHSPLRGETFPVPNST